MEPKPNPLRWNARKEPLRKFQVGHIEHPPIKADGACGRISSESRDHRSRLCDGDFTRREHFVDDVHLSRMDRYFTGKAVAPCFLALAAQSIIVLKRRVDRIDRLRPGSNRAEQTQGSHQTKRLDVTTIRIALRLGADIRRQILGAPRQTTET